MTMNPNANMEFQQFRFAEYPGFTLNMVTSDSPKREWKHVGDTFDPLKAN